MHVLHLDVTKDEHIAAAKEFVGMQNTNQGRHTQYIENRSGQLYWTT